MLEINGLTKVFGRGASNEKRALSGVSLRLGEGEFLTVVGSNGAGKSTLLNAIAGCFPVDEGRILLDGRDITGLQEHHRAAWIGRVFQDPLLGSAAHMSIEENLALAASRGRKRGLRRGVTDAGRRRYREALAQLGLGLEDRLQAPVGQLSGGQRQALALLMATIAGPRLLLLDEHTAALDPRTAEQVLRITEQIVRSSGLTALMVTHNLQEALTMGDRTVMMHEGEIVLDLAGERRRAMRVEDLLAEFARVRGERLMDDRLLLQ